jgi:hypothetical protein
MLRLVVCAINGRATTTRSIHVNYVVECVMNNEYAVFAERELVLRRRYAKAQQKIDQMPYDQLRAYRDELDWFIGGRPRPSHEVAREMCAWVNAEIARRHNGCATYERAHVRTTE